MTDARSLVETLWCAFDERRFSDALEVLAPDFEARWPQTREHISGASNFVALNEAYPGQWRCHLRRVEVLSEQRVTALVEITNAQDDGRDDHLHAIGFYDVAAGRIVRAEEYFADSSEPPYDRSAWAERY
jgi:hypothetical protein